MNVGSSLPAPATPGTEDRLSHPSVISLSSSTARLDVSGHSCGHTAGT